MCHKKELSVQGKASVFSRLLKFFKPYKLRFFLAFVSLLISASATLTLPVAIRKIVDQGFLGEHAAAMDRYFLILFFIVAIIAVFSSLRFYLVMWLGERIVADIRSAVYRHVIRMDPYFFEVTRTGEVLSRLTTDTTLVQSITGAGFSIALRMTLMLIGSLVMLVITSPKLAGFILLLVPLVVFPLVIYSRKIRRLSRLNQDCIAESSAIAGETLNATAMIQSFVLENYFCRRFTQSVELSFETGRKRFQARAWLSAVSILIVFSAIVVVIRIGTGLVISENMSVGELGQFLVYASIIATSTAALSEVWGDLQRAAGAMERVLELLDTQSNLPVNNSPQLPISTVIEPIRFDNVYFNYPSRPNVHALKHFSLEIKPKETIALVGPSGAGKSTVFQLLFRFYDPQYGKITLGGTDISKMDPQQLRRHLAIVPQDTDLFAADVMENIRYGMPDAGDDQIRAAAKSAAADEFVRKLPEGYASFLGEKGIRLSGGQQQRIAIARAILKNPPILLLDEATSSLDAESELSVQKALEHLMKDRTTIIIAHRLATVLKADRIIVMDQGQIVATGKHQELLLKSKLYARLAELQFPDSF